MPKRLAFLLFALGAGCVPAHPLNPDGSQTPHLSHVSTIDVSPDGRWLVFDGQGNGNADLYRLELQTGKVERLTDSGAEELQPKFSPDGKRVVFSRGAPGFAPSGYLHPRHLYVLDIASQKVTQLTDDSARFDYSPAFSPNGRFVAFDGAVPRNGSPHIYVGDVYMVEVATGKTKRLTHQAYNSSLRPVWHEREIVYEATHNAYPTEGMYLLSVSVSSPHTPALLTPKGANYYAARSCGQGRMVLISDPAQKWVWKLTVREANGAYRFLDDSVNGLMSPTFDPTNQRIYYLEGQNNVYRYDLQTGTKKQIADDLLFTSPFHANIQ